METKDYIIHEQIFNRFISRVEKSRGRLIYGSAVLPERAYGYDSIYEATNIASELCADYPDCLFIVLMRSIKCECIDYD